MPGDDYVYDANGNLRWDKNKGGKELLTNGDFSAGSSSWTIVSDATNRFSFSGGDLVVTATSTASTIKQADVVVPKLRYLAIIDIERTSATGNLNVYVGGTVINLSATGKTMHAVGALSSYDLQITAFSGWAGKVKSIELKGLLLIDYNYLNLPEVITKGKDKNLQYVYDATGRKLAQFLYETDGTLLKKSDYVGEYFYENDTLKFINTEEGRVVMTGGAEYQYHLKDHLGNVRLTFTTKNEIDRDTATFETDKLAQEQSKFLRMENARRVKTNLFDHTLNSTSGDGYAQRLSGGTNEKFGIARSISVMPGDTLNLKVFAKYVDPNASNSQALLDLITAIGGAAAGVVVDGAGYASSTPSFPIASPLVQTPVGTAPKAYLNWLVFNRTDTLLDGGYKQITTAARETGSNTAHEEISKENLIITEPGIVYIYISNEETTPVEVFFDDLTIEHIKSPVIQEDDYYPFGLTFNSYKRENSVINKIKFQGQEHIDDLDLGWDSFKWRNHMPDIGRFFNVDPLAEKYLYNSPYAFSENKVTAHVELEGLEAESIKRAGATATAVGLAVEKAKPKPPEDGAFTKARKAFGNFLERNISAKDPGLGFLKVFSIENGGGFHVESTKPNFGDDSKARKGDPSKKALDASPVLAPKTRNEITEQITGLGSETIERTKKAEASNEQVESKPVKRDTVYSTSALPGEGLHNVYRIYENGKQVDSRSFVDPPKKH